MLIRGCDDDNYDDDFQTMGFLPPLHACAVPLESRACASPSIIAKLRSTKMRPHEVFSRALTTVKTASFDDCSPARPRGLGAAAPR